MYSSLANTLFCSCSKLLVMVAFEPTHILRLVKHPSLYYVYGRDEWLLMETTLETLPSPYVTDQVDYCHELHGYVIVCSMEGCSRFDWALLCKGKTFSTTEQVLSHIPLLVESRDTSWHSPNMFIEVQLKCVQTGGFTLCRTNTCQHEPNHSVSGVVTWWQGHQNKHLWRKHHLKTGNTTKAEVQVALYCYPLRSTKKK